MRLGHWVAMLDPSCVRRHLTHRPAEMNSFVNPPLSESTSSFRKRHRTSRRKRFLVSPSSFWNWRKPGSRLAPAHDPLTSISRLPARGGDSNGIQSWFGEALRRLCSREGRGARMIAAGGAEGCPAWASGHWRSSGSEVETVSGRSRELQLLAKARWTPCPPMSSSLQSSSAGRMGRYSARPADRGIR